MNSGLMRNKLRELVCPALSKRPYLVLFFTAVILNVFVAWGCIVWSPYTIHTKPSNERSSTGYPATIVGPYGERAWWFTASGFGVSQAVPSGARGAEGRFVYWRGSHTPAYYRGGWPMHSMQSTVTFHDYRARWELPAWEILKRGLQTNWLPEWLHAQQGRRLPLVPFWPGCLINALLYFVALTGLRLFWVRFLKPTPVLRNYLGGECSESGESSVSIS